MMDDATLDALLKSRERFNAQGRCDVCAGEGRLGGDMHRPGPRTCNHCGGEGWFRLESDSSCALLALAAFQRGVIRDMAEEGRAAAKVMELKAMVRRLIIQCEIHDAEYSHTTPTEVMLAARLAMG